MADKPPDKPVDKPPVVDFSTAAALFPDAKNVFGVTLKPLSKIKDSCLVVLDTNVLLVPYTINPKGLDEVAKAYKKLVGEKRLIVPAQVAREFAKNRPNKLSELYQQLFSKRSKLQPFQRGQYPLLDSLPQYTEVVEIEKALDKQLEKYKEALSKVLDHVREWNWNDPVSLLYGGLFVPEVVSEPTIAKEDLESDFKRRQQHKIPPGYKDSAKDDLGVGDVLIWHTILELGKREKKDVIFVSADGKSDWYHQSDGPLYPRFELVDEFRRASGGASFHILKFSDFLDLFGAKETVVKEVRQEEAKLAVPFGSSDLSKGFRIKALVAVVEWLNGQFSNHTVEPELHDEVDFSIALADGRKRGVIVKSVRNPLAWKEDIVRMVDRSRQRATSSSNFCDYIICLVAEGRESAMALAKFLERHEISSGASELCIGWLDEQSAYSVAGRFHIS
jgi:hypothetical protein